MLLRFGVANHLSVRDKQELLFTASSLKDETSGLLDCTAAPSGFVVPAVVIYGANASGKTNVVDAIDAMKHMILLSHTRGMPGGGVPRRHFMLDDTSSETPSCFEMDFVMEGVRHHYGFEATDKAFVSEWLYAYPRSSRRRLFEREDGQFHFGRGLGGPNRTIAALVRPNSLYVSTAAQNGHAQLSKIFAYFQSIRSIRDITIPGAMVSAYLGDKDLDHRVIYFLKKINTGVTDYRRLEISIPEEIQSLQQEIFTMAGRMLNIPDNLNMEISDKQIMIELSHRNREGESIYFDLDRESAGTRRLLIVLSDVFRALDEGTPFCVDELDASLHTHASEAILKLFCSRETNPKGAQLIATTHDTNLIKTRILRRDQIWFTEKNIDGTTQLYPLTDIQTRRDDNLEKGYLQGRYGAVPYDYFESDLGTAK